MKSDPLLDPFQLGHLTLRNRIVSTAHAPNFVENGHPKDRYRLYREEKAKGGLALTMVGGSTNIAADSPSVFGQLYAGDDSIIPWFQHLTNGVKAHGAAIMCQITHMGRRTAWDDGEWLPVLGPSGLRERAHRAFPKIMEDEDILRVVDDFSQAARRCHDGGFDGIEILSHSHLLGQFLSPHINTRQDDYGGCLENRLRLTLAVLKAVRLSAGPDVLVGIRLTGDEMIDGGIGPDECVDAARILGQSGLIDFINVLAGAPYDDLGLAGWVPPMGMPVAAHLPIAGRIRRATGLPVIHAGGISDLATARHALENGHVDLVRMTRAHLADPYLVSKLTQGNDTQIRPCVGLGYCVDRVNQGKPAVCGQNAATGREATLPHVITPSSRKRKVVIIGAGPGGLEAARVSALRGHDVVQFEASPQPGGQLLLAAQGTLRRQVQGITDWLVDQVTRLGVDLRCNTYAESADVLNEAPDLVVVATGGWPEPPDISGQFLATSSWDILNGTVRPSGDVLLIDETGDHPGVVVVDVITSIGCQLEYVTPDRSLLHDLGPATSSVALKKLAQSGVTFTCLHELSAIQPENRRKTISLRHVLTGEISKRVVDHVVVEHGLSPADAIYHDLKSGSLNRGKIDHAAWINGRAEFPVLNASGTFHLARIGDAIAGRNIHAALLDALRLCNNY
ncbi:MAG: oxidoreductase [Paracoccaceae bacterium]